MSDVDHGVPAARVITALTLVNVRILGQNKNLGTIEAGKLPAITVVSGNPPFHVVAPSNMDGVVTNGVPYRGSQRLPVDPRAAMRRRQ